MSTTKLISITALNWEAGWEYLEERKNKHSFLLSNLTLQHIEEEHINKKSKLRINSLFLNECSSGRVIQTMNGNGTMAIQIKK